MSAPYFYSKLMRSVEVASMSAALPDVWLRWLKWLPKIGVSSHEIEFSYVRDWLELQSGQVSKASVLAYLRDACPAVGTVLLSNAVEDQADPEFGGYPRFFRYAYYDWATTNNRELLLVLRDEEQRSSKFWRDIPNVLVHVCLHEMTDDHGRVTLLVALIQSDWMQCLRHGRKAIRRSVREGFAGMVKRMRRAGELDIKLDGRYVYRGQVYDEIAMREALCNMTLFDAAPYVFHRIDPVCDLPLFDSTNKWVGLALKGVLRLAVDKRINRVAISSGASLDCGTSPAAIRTDKRAVGKRVFYDRVVPAVAKDVLHKLGGKLSTVTINGFALTGFDISETMREKVRAGLPMF